MNDIKYTNLERVMTDYGRALAADLQETVPVKTGALKKSIKFKGLIKINDGFEVDIEALYYFTYLDKGTKFIVPRHYLNKSISKVNKLFSKEIAEASGKDIKLSLIKELKNL